MPFRHRPIRYVLPLTRRRSTTEHRLRLESLESRALPTADLLAPFEVSATSAGTAPVPPINYNGSAVPTGDRVAPPAYVEAPRLPALSGMSDAVASAVLNAWKLPQGTRTAEWVIQLTAGQSPDVLLSVGAESFKAVPYWADAYEVKFATPQDVASFPAVLEPIGGSAFYYPVLPMDVDLFYAPNDQYYPNQWHLNNTGQSGGTPGSDANLEAAWDIFDSGNNRVLGTGVTIGIVDDSFQHTHPDLSPNYVAADSWDFVGNDSDPSPDSDDNHGTSVGGVSGARGNNSTGVSGAAPNASLAGLRFIDAFSDATAAGALGYHQQSIDVYNSSWGPVPMFFNVFEYVPFGPQTFVSMNTGVASGRGGLGNVFVNAAGNSGGQADNVNYNAFSNSRYNTTVAAIDHNGVRSSYSEPGAPLFVSAYSNSEATGITTTDVTGAQGYGGMADSNYTNGFGGTSSASPLVSGVVALMLDVNPNLTWRDVRHILARTAVMNDPNNTDWDTNGAGFHINHNYGFGAIDAAAAVSMAKTWNSVPAEVGRTTNTIAVGQAIPDNNTDGVNSQYTISTTDMDIETIEIVLNVTHNYPHDLLVALISPSGTVSILAAPQFAQQDIPNITSWVYTTNRHWGESTLGTWTLHVSDRIAFDSGTFVDWKMNVYGTDPVVPPALANIESTNLNYTAGSGEAKITNALTVSDADSANLNGATVAISSNYMNGQDFLRFTNQNGISGSFNTGNGILTLTGSASVANYQTALRSISYENTSGSPSTATRTVTFQVTDNTSQQSNTQARSITVQVPANQPPALSGMESSQLTYTAGQGELQITQALTVTDSDSANLSGATVSISSNYINGQDFLNFVNQNGIIGSFSGGTLTLTGSSSVANYQAALRSVKYENTSGSPSTATRTVTFQVTDGSLQSNTQSRNIAVQAPANQPPVLSGIESSTLSYNAGQGELQITQTLSVSDGDSTNLSGATVAISSNYVNGEDFLRFTNQNGITGSFSAGTGILTLSGSSSVANYQAALRSVEYENTSGSPSTATRTVTFRVTDNTSLQSNTQSRNIGVSSASGPGTIEFVSAEYKPTQEGGNFKVVVQRVGGTSGAASAQFATANGTATEGSDYTDASGPLNWSAGEGGNKEFFVTITTDSINEGPESINLALSNVTGAAAGLANAILVIPADDGIEINPLSRKAVITDTDGDIVTIRFSGRVGTAEIFLTNDDVPIDLIRLTDTNAFQSSLSITVKRNRFGSTDNGRVKVNAITGDGLKTLSARSVNLTGSGIQMTDALGYAYLGNLLQGADIVTGGGALNFKTRLRFDTVDDGSDITLTNPLSTFRANKVGTGTITAPAIGSITVLGNFEANISVDGTAALPGKPALRVLKVLGNVIGSTIDVKGDVASVSVGGFRDSILRVGYSGDVDGSDPFDGNTLRSFRTTGLSNSFQNSHVLASLIKSVSLASVKTNNLGNAFGIVGEFIQKVRVRFPVIRFPGQDGMGDFEIKVV